MRSWLDRLRGLFRAGISTSELQTGLSATHASAGKISIVALVAARSDRELLSRLAIDHQWVLRFAENCSEAWDALNESKAPIVLCDRELPAAEWRDVIQMMVSSAHQAYAILLSKVADDYLWNEVIRLGGHDLLTTPLREEDVLRAIRLAWFYWSNSMNAQPMLMKDHR
jgi:DNA-binding NarL/FixJ family response regulator